jgi:hypothetical protein
VLQSSNLLEVTSSDCRKLHKKEIRIFVTKQIYSGEDIKKNEIRGTCGM